MRTFAHRASSYKEDQSLIEENVTHTVYTLYIFDKNMLLARALNNVF